MEGSMTVGGNIRTQTFEAALHAMCAYFLNQEENLPGWLAKMAQVPAKHVGKLDRLQLVARGLSITASMEHGSIKISWLEVILTMRANKLDSTNLERDIRALCLHLRFLK